MHHHIEMALNPNLIGQTMIRRVQIDGADLTLSAVPDEDGNSAASCGGGCRANNAYKINRLKSAFLARSPMCLLHIGGVDRHGLAGAVGGA